MVIGTTIGFLKDVCDNDAILVRRNIRACKGYSRASSEIKTFNVSCDINLSEHVTKLTN